MSEAIEQARPNKIPTPAELGFDPAELREKYAAERVKRLRPDGNNQYQEITGKFAHFNDDPYVAPIKREAISEDLDAVIIGAGFGGLLAAARLRAQMEAALPAGVSEFEEAGDQLFTFTAFPAAQWKALRTTNALERINEEFRRRTQTQAALPNEEAVLLLLFGLLRSGQIKLRRLVGWRELVSSSKSAEAA